MNGASIGFLPTYFAPLKYFSATFRKNCCEHSLGLFVHVHGSFHFIIIELGRPVENFNCLHLDKSWKPN